MNIELTPEAHERLAFGTGLVGADGGLLTPSCAADLAALPAFEADGKPLQPDGTKLLADWVVHELKGDDVDPGMRLCFPYREVEFDNGMTTSKRELRYFLPYQKGNQKFNPVWLKEVVKPQKSKGGKDDDLFGQEIVLSVVEGAPYLYHKRRLLTVEVKEGEVQLNNPDMPCKVVDEFEGRTDDLRSAPLRLSPNADHKDLSSYGFLTDAQGAGRWREINRAQAGANSGLKIVYCTPGKGWLKFPGSDAPHYVFGDRVVAPVGGPELRAVSRSGNGPVNSMGVETIGSFQAWKAVMRVVLRNPEMAALMGFSASAPMLGLIKEMEAGIIHVVGGSGLGKSTMLKVMASLIGSADGPKEAGAYVQSWNSTENAMEGPLEARSDAPSFYDELYELPKGVDILALLYRVTNGRGKQRMTKEIESRLVKVWKTQIISTGEGSFASRIAQDGHEYFPGGLQFRVMEIYAELMGLFSHAAAEANKEGHGAYGWLVDKHRSSAPTAAGRIIEAIEMELKGNHGHFWERWIARLQDPKGRAEAESWFESERAGLQPHIPESANPIFVRRSKHVAAAMAGLRGILALCEFPEHEQSEILEAARAWSIDHLWGSGIQKKGQEGDLLYERFNEWLAANESSFHKLADRYDPTGPTKGWIERDGTACLVRSELRRSAAEELKLDLGRLEKSMEAEGWELSRKRHPRGGRLSSAMHVWQRKEFFRSSRVSTEHSGDEIFGQA